MEDWTNDWHDFAVISWRQDGRLVLLPAGELDRAAAPLMRSELAAVVESRPPLVVVDLHEVTFVDAAGLGVLLRAARSLAAQGSRLVLASPQRTVRRVLEMTDVDKALDVHDSIDAALARSDPTSVRAER